MRSQMLNFTKILNYRFDCFLIWGHGMKYLNQILEDIANHESFEIKRIIKHRPRTIKKLVKEVYAYDYAPFWHLKDKSKYLMGTKNEVCFIFIKNNHPNIDFYGEKNFRHLESKTIKAFKEMIRDKYNSYENGIRSHDHVLHATDSQEQTHYLLKYLKYYDGINSLEQENNNLEIPFYVKGFNSFSIKEIECSDLFCNIAYGKSWEKFKIKRVNIRESPQYLSLIDGIEIYKNYIQRFLGGPLKQYYSINRYEELKSSFNYLIEPFNQSFVVVSRDADGFLVLDGLHRSCLHIYQNKKKIKVCLIGT